MNFSLPLPWLLWTIANGGQGLGVSSTGAACYITLLFVMLVIVFVAILIFKWKMTKSMGGMMIVLYFVFVILSLGFNYQWYTCPF